MNTSGWTGFTQTDIRNIQKEADGINSLGKIFFYTKLSFFYCLIVNRPGLLITNLLHITS